MGGDYTLRVIMRRVFYVILFRLINVFDRVEQIRNKEKMSGEPLHITDESFEKVVMQSELPVIVDFWAPWCNPCKMIAPTLDKLAKELDGKIVIAKVNTDDHAEWMQKFGIQGIPTLLFVSNGKVVHFFR